jgi:hypothetical protein
MLLLLIFFAWFLLVCAAAAATQLEGARRGLPQGQRGGVSCLPIVPIAPLLLWGTAIGVDSVAASWGTWVIATLHACWIVYAAVSITRDAHRLRAIDKGA